MTNSLTGDYPQTTELTSSEGAKQLSPWYRFKLLPSKQPLMIIAVLWAAICIIIYDSATKLLGMSVGDLAWLTAFVWLLGFIALWISYQFSERLTCLLVNKEGKVVIESGKLANKVQRFSLAAESKLTWFGIYLALSPTRPLRDEKQYYFIARDGLEEADYRRLAAIVVKANRA